MRIFVVLFVLFSFSCFSQLDKRGTIDKDFGKIGGNTTMPDNKVEQPKLLDADNDFSGFKTAKRKLDNDRAKKQQQQKEEDKGIITSAQMSKESYQKNIEGNQYNFPQIDMDLGSFTTTSENLHIVGYDFGRFDGDRFRIELNGKVVKSNVLLTPRRKGVTISLQVGINKLEVFAINEGELSPNTAYFAFFDDSKKVVKEGKWMLATGAKVVAVIVRQ